MYGKTDQKLLLEGADLLGEPGLLPVVLGWDPIKSGNDDLSFRRGKENRTPTAEKVVFEDARRGASGSQGVEPREGERGMLFGEASRTDRKGDLLKGKTENHKVEWETRSSIKRSAALTGGTISTFVESQEKVRSTGESAWE